MIRLFAALSLSLAACQAQPPGSIVGVRIVPGSPQRPQQISADVALQIGHNGPIAAMAFHPDGALLATAAEDGDVILWNPQTADQVARLSGNTGPVRSLAWLNGDLLASGADEGTMRIWDAREQSLLRRLSGCAMPVLQWAASPDGGYLVSAEGPLIPEGGAAVRLWNITAGARRQAAFSPGLRWLAGSSPGVIGLWDITIR